MSLLNENFVSMTDHFFKDPKWSINIHYFVNLLKISTRMKILALQVDLHTSHYQLVDSRNENEIWDLKHHFIRATPSLQQSLQWEITCINVVIKVVLNKNFVPMINHLPKYSKLLINIHSFVDLIFSTGMKILVQLST